MFAIQSDMIPYVIIGIALIIALIVISIKSLSNPVVSGKEDVIGQIGLVRTKLNPKGVIFVDGGLWSAESLEGEVDKGDEVVVTEMVGLKLKVKKNR